MSQKSDHHSGTVKTEGCNSAWEGRREGGRVRKEGEREGEKEEEGWGGEGGGGSTRPGAAQHGVAFPSPDTSRQSAQARTAQIKAFTLVSFRILIFQPSASPDINTVCSLIAVLGCLEVYHSESLHEDSGKVT